MPTTDLRIDAYIERSASFAKPILKHIRKLVHKACPAAEETIKWGMPYFDYKNAILCNMASFKEHCAFGFWKAAIMSDPEKLFNRNGKNAMGQFDRITSLKDLPADKVLIAYIQEAARLNEEEIKLPPKTKGTEKKVLEVPEYMAKALAKNKKAQSVFEHFSPSNKKDYIEWITEAKTETTRNKRLQTAVEWMADRKIRNWKYTR